MNTQLWQKVSQALSNSVAQQPVANTERVDKQPENGKKANSKAGMGNTKIKNVNAFSPNKSYSVEAIKKAQAKIGGH